MNRKQKIIMSVTGIFIVLLILVGLTYAYFLTRINGNTNEKSVSISTEYLSLTYADGNGTITANKISPGITLATKTFSVENTGDSETDYVVSLENVNITYTSGETTTFESNDFVYDLTCTSSIEDETCDQIENGILPLNDGILITQEIQKDEIQSYTLTITYKETEIDQSADMNKILEAKVNIKDIKSINPYSSNTNSLAYNIIYNSLINKNGTVLINNPILAGYYYKSKGDEVSGQEYNISLSNSSQITKYITYATNYKINKKTGYATLINPTTCKYSDGCINELINQGKGVFVLGSNVRYLYSDTDTLNNYKDVFRIYKVIEAPEPSNDTISLKVKTVSPLIDDYERDLAVTNDDYGVSYYYRGLVQDNYLDFANMCWRVVRIQGDGSIKLILEDKNNTCLNSTENWNLQNYFYGPEEMPNDEDLIRMPNLNPILDNTNSVLNTFKNFQNYFTEYLSYLKKSDWCYDSIDMYKYDLEVEDLEFIKIDSSNKDNYSEEELLYNINARLQLNKPTLKCLGTKLNSYSDGTDMYIGTLTGDEVVYAGAGLYAANQYFYLYNNETSWWLLSLDYYYDGKDYISELYKSGAYTTGGGVVGSRPSIILKNGTTILNGDGTKSNPYKIN